MPHEKEKSLHDLLDSAQFLANFTTGRTFEQFLSDRGFRSAIERELIIIGEAVLRLQKLDPLLVARINEHQRIISFRNVLVHGYDAIKPDLVWLVVTDKLQQLIHDAEAIRLSLDTT